MWKRAEPDRGERRAPTAGAGAATKEQPAASGVGSPTALGGPMTAEHAGERAIIGASITIRGDVTGDEDLVIQGRVEGKVDLAQHNVTVGAKGRIKANVIGRTVTVEGEVEGDLRAEEQIAVRKTGKVRGNMSAPRVTIEDGASFQGSIDMERKAAPVPRAAPVAAPSSHVTAGAAPVNAPAPRAGETKTPDRTG